MWVKGSKSRWSGEGGGGTAGGCAPRGGGFGEAPKAPVPAPDAELSLPNAIREEWGFF